MSYILHIVAKDLTALRWQILLLLALQFTYAAMLFKPLGPAGPGMAEIVLGWLIILTHFCFIGCAIHAEAIPGDRQYWLTRPFTRGQLLAAKLVLVLLVIHLPLFLSDCIILIGHQFNPFAHLGGLLWRQLLYLVAGTSIMFAIAAVTRNFSEFALAAIVLIAGVVLLPSVVLVRPLAMHWGGLYWIQILFTNLLIACATAAILYLLYGRRNVLTARSVLASAALLIPFGSGLAPFAIAFDLQRQLNASPQSAMKVSFDPARIRPSGSQANLGDSKQITLSVPVTVENAPTGVSLNADFVSGTIRFANGETHRLPARGSWPGSQWVFFTIDQSYYRQYADQPVTIDVAMYLTAFGAARKYSLPVQSPERAMTELGRCDAHPDRVGIILVSCYAPVRFPSRVMAQLVHQQFGAYLTRDIRLNDGFNYSPLPSDRFQMHPIHYANSNFSITHVPGQDLAKIFQRLLESKVDFYVRDAQSHFNASFTVPPLRLRDLIQ